MEGKGPRGRVEGHVELRWRTSVSARGRGVLDHDGRARRSDAHQAARGRAFEPPGVEPSDASTVYLSWLVRTPDRAGSGAGLALFRHAVDGSTAERALWM